MESRWVFTSSRMVGAPRRAWLATSTISTIPMADTRPTTAQQIAAISLCSITSFNEWHEGSQIEPARNNPPAGYGYLTYLNAYGRTDSTAEMGYMDRTRYWINVFNP